MMLRLASLLSMILPRGSTSDGITVLYVASFVSHGSATGATWQLCVQLSRRVFVERFITTSNSFGGFSGARMQMCGEGTWTPLVLQTLRREGMLMCVS